MYIRLVPRRTDDTAVVYNIGFKSLPESLLPQRWLGTHHQLRVDGVIEPESIYALDAASAPVAIIHQVEFDLRCRTISCTFINGKEEVWPIDSPRRDHQGRTCEEMLDSVSDDVRMPPPEPVESQVPEQVAPSPSKGKHKRKSSLFMTLIKSVQYATESSVSVRPGLTLSV
jgi:lysozyme family protein